ncbi:curli biogenesis system outer membrane secretion channel CsgG [Chitinivorax tropicus]|uniref:Curli biogenesis system outer membrane secretion channel CsgG n=1 Tax=Chitinivorax tropicus TaxID=714531 RepID=A0A840MMY0_9PROT|nr:CsgG/HfaB family protein [Chitinivorax tropicus]MBB5019998.1 curli biogenesis system outer membrane secretion channel CsgG [Chitinivorax tropicus]
MNVRISLACLFITSLISACDKPAIETGNAGGLVTGAAGQKGSSGETRRIEKCAQPIATIGVMENPNGYTYTASRGNIPESPLPLVRMMLQQSGCFRVVDRSQGLKGTRQELDLKDEGLTRDNTTVNPRKHVLEAQYIMTPTLVFSEKNAGGSVGGVLAQIPVLAKFAGAAEHVKFKEAQVVLSLTDTQTTEQVVIAEGSARATDLGAGGLMIGAAGGAGGAGWNHTNEGKVISAAFLDAVNKMIPHVRDLQAKSLPPAPAVKG